MTEIKDILADMRDEYLQPHDWPWIIGYSGGKDSTLVTHLVFEMLLALPPSDRKRTVHVIGNDTLVESPLVIKHLIDSMEDIRKGAEAFGLPVVTQITRPDPDQSFWVNLIGRGYPTPKMGFRWCTDRMKIRPTTAYIKSKVKENGNAILLLGVRRSESSERAKMAKRYDATRNEDNPRLNPRGDLPGCFVYRPILELDTDDVWEYLGENEPPWGASHLHLINLYRHSLGGECPVVTQKDDIPSCGSSSSRFGCWTCTVVQKDKSLEGFVDSGFEEFTPLLEFRDWLRTIRDDPARRQLRRRNGLVTFTDDGSHVPGPFTVEARMEIFDHLQELQKKVGMELISEEEIDIIQSMWATDILSHAVKASDAQTLVLEGGSDGR